MIMTERQFKAAQMILTIRPDEDLEMFERMTYDYYVKIRKAMEESKYEVVCSVDPTHRAIGYCRGKWQVDLKTGEIIDEEADDEEHQCGDNPEDKTISMYNVDMFEDLVATK